MSGDGGSSSSAQQMATLFSRGRLMFIPRKPAHRESLVTHLAETLFELEREYSECEVNEALLTVHHDFSALRRCLVVAGWLDGTGDGRCYRRVR